MSIIDDLIKKSEKEYGDNYKSHYFEIYKLYVEMADRISSRRQTANSFFLSINTAVIAYTSYFHTGLPKDEKDSFYWIVSLAGIILSYMWYRLIRSYKNLNSGKFKVIHSIEENLPLSPYDAEWEALGKGKDSKLYRPFTNIEMFVPWIFLILHFAVLLRIVFFMMK